MILTPFKRIRTEEPMLERVQDSVTESVEKLRNILNGGVRRKDNLYGQLLTKEITVPDDWYVMGSPGGPVVASGWYQWADPSYGSVAVRRDADGLVRWRGLISHTSFGTGTMLNIPTAFLPHVNWIQAIPNSAGLPQTIVIAESGATKNLYVLTGGVANNSWYSLDCLTWEGANRTPLDWPTQPVLTLDATFPTDVAGLHIVSAVESGTKVNVTGVTPRWTASTAGGVRTVTLKSIPGLVPLKTYTVTFFVEAA